MPDPKPELDAWALQAMDSLRDATEEPEAERAATLERLRARSSEFSGEAAKSWATFGGGTSVTPEAKAPEAPAEKPAPRRHTEAIKLTPQATSSSSPMPPPVPGSVDPEWHGIHGLLTQLTPDTWYDTRREGEAPGAQHARNEAEWAAERAKAQKEGYAVQRLRDQHGIRGVAAALEPYIGALAMGRSRGEKWGLPDRALQAAGAGLGAVGVNSVGDAVKNVQQTLTGDEEGDRIDLPGLEGLGEATEIGSAMRGRSYGSRVAGQVTARRGLANTKLERIIQGALAGGLDRGGNSAVDVAAGDKSIGRAVMDTGIGVAAGGAFAPMMHWIMEAAGAGVNRLRGRARGGAELNNAEAAGVRTGYTGMHAPPEIEAARAQQARPVPDEAQRAADPSLENAGKPALDITVQNAVDALHPELNTYREGVPARIQGELGAYADSPQGQAPQSLEPVIAALEQRIANGTGADGLPMPAERLEDYRRVLAQLVRGEFSPAGGGAADRNMPLQQARQAGVPFDEQAIDRLASEKVADTKLLMNPEFQRVSADGRAATALKPPDPKVAQEFKTPAEAKAEGYTLDEKRLQDQARRGVEEGGSVNLSPRALNAEQLENTIRGFARQYRNANVRGEHSGAEDFVGQQLREMRSDFDPHPTHAPADTGGYAGLRGRHAGMMDELEQTLESFNLPRNIDDIATLDRVAMRRALDTAVRGFHEAGVDPHMDTPARRKFLAGRPNVERLMRLAAGHRDLQVLEGQPGIGASVGAALTGNLKSAVRGLPGAGASAMRHLDPLAQRVAGVSRGAPRLMSPTLEQRLAGETPGPRPPGNAVARATRLTAAEGKSRDDDAREAQRLKRKKKRQEEAQR